VGTFRSKSEPRYRDRDSDGPGGRIEHFKLVLALVLVLLVAVPVQMSRSLCTRVLRYTIHLPEGPGFTASGRKQLKFTSSAARLPLAVEPNHDHRGDCH
jgi:hypothetical protein